MRSIRNILSNAFLDNIYSNWFRVTFASDHGRRICGPDLSTFRRGVRTFAPDGFLSRVNQHSVGNHSQHDQRYIGSFPRQLLDSQGIPIQGRYLHNQLSSVIKCQFEPILENEFQPVPHFVQNLSDYLGKSTGSLFNMNNFLIVLTSFFSGKCHG